MRNAFLKNLLKQHKHCKKKKKKNLPLWTSVEHDHWPVYTFYSK